MLICCVAELCLTILGKKRADVCEYCIINITLMKYQVVLTLSFVLVESIYSTELAINYCCEFSNLVKGVE